MKKYLKTIFGLFLCLFFVFNIASAETKQPPTYPQIDFFYSNSCSYCAKEKIFLADLQSKYPELTINRYEISEKGSFERLNLFAKIYPDLRQHLGMVPVTIVEGKSFVGFDGTRAEDIEKLVANKMKVVKEFLGEDFKPIEINQNTTTTSATTTSVQDSTKTASWFEQIKSLKGIDAEKYSLPVLALILGFLDGFNICSLGALLLILSIVLAMGSRKKIAIFGGIYLLTAGSIYAGLIFLWYRLFQFIGPFIPAFEIIIGATALIGGVFLIYEFLRMIEFGPVCDFAGNKTIDKFAEKMKNTFSGKKGIVGMIVAVIIFSAMVTIIEFPCSAVVPVIFTAIVSESNVPIFTSVLYILIYMTMYLLDEIIVFLIAIKTMKIVGTSKKQATFLILIQAIVFLGIAIFYLSKLF